MFFFLLAENIFARTCRWERVSGIFVTRRSIEPKFYNFLVRIRYYDTDTYKYEPTEKLLACWEKDKYGKNCHEQQKHFSAFVLSMDGMLRKEAL